MSNESEATFRRVSVLDGPSIVIVKYLDGALCGDVVGEIPSVVITLEASDRKDELRRFHLPLHVTFSDGPHVYLQHT